MKDKDFEKAMREWTDHETASAPELRPTAEMYRTVRAGRKSKVSFFTSQRWALGGAAAACLAVLAVSYAVFMRPSGGPSSRETAYVGLREGVVFEGGQAGIKLDRPPGRGGKKGPALFRQLVLQVQSPESRTTTGIDLLGPREEAIALTAADNYRLLLESSKDRYVYVFQLISSGVLVELFPNETYSAVRNPLHQGRTYLLPSEPSWLHLGDGVGRETLYVVSSAQRLADLADLYSQYAQERDESRGRESLQNLLRILDAVEVTYQGEAAGWVFEFNHQ